MATSRVNPKSGDFGIVKKIYDFRGGQHSSIPPEEIGDNVGEIDALVDGEPAKIAFNAKYLSDVLSVLKQSQVALEITTSSSPGVFRPVGVDNYVHVVMPMFVQW